MKVWKIIEHENGDVISYLNDLCHSRHDYASVRTEDYRYMMWHHEGKLHRIYGPAVVKNIKALDWKDYYEEYWLNGVQYSKDEWKKKLEKV